MELGLVLDMAAEDGPDRVAIVDVDDATLTRGELRNAARRAAARFLRAGAQRVGYLAPNGRALPVALFGAALAGIPFVPCFLASSPIPLVICSWKWLYISCKSSTFTATVEPAGQSPFFVADTLAFTVLSVASGVSVRRATTSPDVKPHSVPLFTAVTSVSTTKVRCSGSKAGGTWPLAFDGA